MYECIFSTALSSLRLLFEIISNIEIRPVQQILKNM